MKKIDLSVEEITATLIPYGVQRILSSLELEVGVRNRLTLDSWLDPLLHGMVIQLRTAIAGNDQRTQKTFSWPKTWWDAFKLKYAPSWFLARYPVNYHTETITTHVIYTCPHLNTAAQPSDHLSWLKYGPENLNESR